MTKKPKDAKTAIQNSDPLLGPLTPALHVKPCEIVGIDDTAQDERETFQRMFVSISALIRQAGEVNVDGRIGELMNLVEKNAVFRLDRFGRYMRADPEPVQCALERLWDWKNDNWAPPIDSETHKILWDPFDELSNVGWYKDEVPAPTPSLESADSEPLSRSEKMSRTKVKHTYLTVITSLLKQLKIDI